MAHINNAVTKFGCCVICLLLLISLKYSVELEL